MYIFHGTFCCGGWGVGSKDVKIATDATSQWKWMDKLSTLHCGIQYSVQCAVIYCIFSECSRYSIKKM